MMKRLVRWFCNTFFWLHSWKYTDSWHRTCEICGEQQHEMKVRPISVGERECDWITEKLGDYKQHHWK